MKQYQENPENAFSGPGKTASDQAKIAELQRAIGELYMERDFLKKTLKNLEIQLHRNWGETYQSS